MSQPSDHLETTRNPWGIISDLGPEWPEGRGGFMRWYDNNPGAVAKLCETLLGMRALALGEGEELETVEAIDTVALYIISRFPEVLRSQKAPERDSDLGADYELYIPDSRFLETTSLLRASPDSTLTSFGWPPERDFERIYECNPHASAVLAQTLFGMRAVRNWESMEEPVISAINTVLGYLFNRFPEALQEGTDEQARRREIPFSYHPDERLIDFAGELVSNYESSEW
jgi:hypothetical protein